VTKAKADHVVIAGHDGGTGASPISSIKHAGTPWELGLAETQQTLVLNRLRGRVRVQADGQMKTGRDVVIGALLGADEFGFATAPLVVEGCIMMRKCHLNTCPVGVATQDPVLRARFTGQPEHVVNYFFFVAEEVREHMAQLGIRKFDDLIGRTDLLDMKQGRRTLEGQGPRLLAHLLYAADARRGRPLPLRGPGSRPGRRPRPQPDRQGSAGPGARREGGHRNADQATQNRTAGTMLSHEVAKRNGQTGLADDTITVKLTGTAGQSFGAFLARGITSNSPARATTTSARASPAASIVVKPPKQFRGAPEDNIIVGNTVLYGAIAGEVFFRGVGGERFCRAQLRRHWQSSRVPATMAAST
jgi:glutamate synthase (NADPH/NADH) large chain